MSNLSDGNIREYSDGNSIFRRKAGQEQTIKLNKSDFKKYVQSKTEVSYCHAPCICFFPELKIDKNISSTKYVETNFIYSQRVFIQYYTVVMFTAMLSERGCAICKEAAAEYHILANSIRYTGSQEHGFHN